MAGGHVAVLAMEIQIPASASLKDKRAVVKHLLETARQRFRISAAEVGGLDLWQRSSLAFAIVGPSPEQVSEVLDRVERFVWSHPELLVLETSRRWLDVGE